MGPKPKSNKSPENDWRSRIEDAQLNEESWTAMVVLMDAAAGDQARLYLNFFESTAKEENRFVVKNICRTETLFMVNQLGAEKKVKDENLRVFEEGQLFLRDKKDIPPEIFALIIKHLILKMKEEYLFIRRQKLEVEEGLRQESATMITKTEVRGTVVKPPEASPPPVPPPKGKSKGEPDPASLIPEPLAGKKYNTVLRERGEEWRDRVYVDDFPKDGPNLYVAITGFLEPELPAHLVKIGIPLKAIVQIRIDPTNIKVPSALIPSTKKSQSQTEVLNKALKYWEDLQDYRIKENCDDFKDTAFIIFTPPYWASEPLSDNPGKIYDELCYLLYDVQDLSRQHIHFLNNMDIIQVPEEETDERYIENYKQQPMDDLPFECVTIFSLLDSILQIACKDNLDDISSSTSTTSSIPSIKDKIPKAEALVTNVFNTLCKTEADKKQYRITHGKEFEDHKDPIIIKYGDFVKNTTFHLGNINLDNIVASTLAAMPLHKLLENEEQAQGEKEAKINFHVNLLLSCFDRKDVETDELIRLLHILACRKLYNNRSSLKKDHMMSTTIADFKKIYLKRSVLAEPLPQSAILFRSVSNSLPSYPSMTKSENPSAEFDESSEEYRIKFLFDCPDISELVSAVEIANDHPGSHLIDDFEYFEDFHGIQSYQILHHAFNKFNCVDYKYCEVTDCIIMMFFNSHDKNGIARDEWRCHITTPLCLQDFFDFVLDEHYDWIQAEEKIYDKEMATRRQSECQDVIDPFSTVSCIDDTDVEMDLLVEGSLKYQDILSARQSSTTEPSTVTTSKKTVLSPISVESNKTLVKDKRPSAKEKKIKQSHVSVDNVSESLSAPPRKPFTGYDLGDRRVEVFGKDATFFSKDGTCISTSYILLIPSNLEYIVLNVYPGNGNNDIFVHRALGEFVSPEVRKLCQSFRITTKDRVMINIIKKTFMVPLAPVVQSEIEIPKHKGQSTKGDVKQTPKSTLDMPLFETKYYYSFYITWPNGLITESIYNDDSTDISHIKQYHLAPIPELDEEMRCISLNGEVVIFKSSGDIEVLQPDGTYIYITKYEKRLVVQPEPFMLDIVDTGTDKSKKSKSKEKEKPSKGKDQKGTTPVEEEKPPEYELLIEEFEMIKTSGIKQKWINDTYTDIGKLLITTATDFCIGDIFSKRMDGTTVLLNKDGLQITTFPNKTRIITKFVIEEEEIFPEWTEEEIEYFELFDEDINVVDPDVDKDKSKASMSQKSFQSGSFSSFSKRMLGEEEESKPKEKTDGYISVQIIYTIEHVKFTTVTINKVNGKITIDSPNDSSLTVDPNNHYELILDNETSAKFNGENLHISYEACPKCRSYTSCNININDKYEGENIESEEMASHWVKMKDSFCKTVVVDEEGDIQIKHEPCTKEVNLTPSPVEEASRVDETVDRAEEEVTKSDWKSESSITTSHGKCQAMYQAKNVKFIILNRLLDCSELVHRSLLEEYKQKCRWQPWCSINEYDAFGDNRTLHTILSPISITESEKWVMNSKLANKPKNLTFKDLKPDSGKGFYHWMRPYERFTAQPRLPKAVEAHRLPSAYILRTLELQWREPDREQLKGAKELLTAILKYRHTLESETETILQLPIVDIRDNDERLMHELVQALGHKIYNDLRKRLNADVQENAKFDITTLPLPPEAPEEALSGEELLSPEKLIEEERGEDLNKLEEVTKVDPIMEKYWRRRAQELKEEQFYLCLLRAATVPKYFLNIIGGAIWWEMNHIADNAMTRAERRKMKCICAEEQKPASLESTFSVPLI